RSPATRPQRRLDVHLGARRADGCQREADDERQRYEPPACGTPAPDPGSSHETPCARPYIPSLSRVKKKSCVARRRRGRAARGRSRPTYASGGFAGGPAQPVLWRSHRGLGERFAALITSQPTDLGRAALEIARIGQPDPDPEPSLGRLDALAAALAPRLP